MKYNTMLAFVVENILKTGNTNCRARLIGLRNRDILAATFDCGSISYEITIKDTKERSTNFTSIEIKEFSFSTIEAGICKYRFEHKEFTNLMDMLIHDGEFWFRED